MVSQDTVGVGCRIISLCVAIFYASTVSGQDKLQGDACQPPLKTAEYEIRNADWNAALKASLEDRKIVLGAIGGRKRAASAEDYLALGRLIEKHFGHHYLAFEFYDKAFEVVRTERGKKQDRIRTDVAGRLKALATRRFAALEELILAKDEQIFVSPTLTVLPARNLIERRDMEEGNEFYRNRFSQVISDNLEKRISDEEMRRRLDELREETQKLTHHNVFSEDDGGGLPTFHGLSDETFAFFRSGSDELLAKRIAGFAILPRGFHYVVSHEKFTHRAAKFLPDGMLDQPNLRRLTGFSYERDEGECRLTTYSAQRKNVLLTSFLEKFPEFRNQATELIEKVQYDLARQHDELDGYIAYAEAHPSSPYSAAAQRDIERKRYELAVQTNTPAALNDHLAQYPDGTYKAQCIAALTKLAYEAAIKIGTEEALIRFLAENPSSEWEDEARGELAKLSYLAARDSNTIADYEVFIREYPESRFVAEAIRAIDAIRAGESFNRVRKLNTEAGFTRFLSEFPNSSFEAEARAMIAYFQCMKERTIGPCGEFMERHRESTLKEASTAEKKRVLPIILDLARKNTKKGADARAHIVLHQETGADELVPTIFALAETKEQEFYALSAMEPDHLDDRIVSWSGPTFGTDEGLEFDWADLLTFKWSESVRPTIRASFQAGTKFLHVYEIELYINMMYSRTYSGIRWFNEDYAEEIETWTKTYRSRNTLEVGQKMTYGLFSFDRFPTAKRQGLMRIYSYDTASRPSQPEMRVLRILE